MNNILYEKGLRERNTNMEKVCQQHNDDGNDNGDSV